MAQGRESFDITQDRELVEQLVERFKGPREPKNNLIEGMKNDYSGTETHR